MWLWLFSKFINACGAAYKELSAEIMNKAKSYIDHLETDGIYLASEKGNNKFIPWDSISRLTINTHTAKYFAEINLKEGENLKVRISEPFVVAQRIYKVLFNHGDNAHQNLPEFEIN